VATSAEEVHNPRRDLPLGILGALSVVTLCYILMSLVLVMMVPLEALSTAGSFAAAFAYVGLPWAQYIVALGEFVRWLLMGCPSHMGGFIVVWGAAGGAVDCWVVCGRIFVRGPAVGTVHCCAW
jgi:amino acid transporter